MTDLTWICLAAGKGTRLRPITDDIPKAMVPIEGKPLIAWLERAVRSVGIDELAVVTGYLGDIISERSGFTLYENPDYDTTNMVRSLWCASEALQGPVVISYGDILYTPSVLEDVINSPHDVAVTVDRCWRAYWERRHDDPINDAESLSMDDENRVESIGQPVESLASPDGQYVGLIKLSATGTDQARAAYTRAQKTDQARGLPGRCPRPLDDMYMTDLLQFMIDLGMPVHGVPVEGGWIEIDTPRDLEIARTVCQPAEDGTLIIDRDIEGSGMPT